MRTMGHSLMDLPTDKNLHLHFEDNKEALNGGVWCLSLTADWRQGLKEQPPSPKSQESRNEIIPTKGLIEICTTRWSMY